MTGDDSMIRTMIDEGEYEGRKLVTNIAKVEEDGWHEIHCNYRRSLILVWISRALFCGHFWRATIGDRGEPSAYSFIDCFNLIQSRASNVTRYNQDQGVVSVDFVIAHYFCNISSRS